MALGEFRALYLPFCLQRQPDGRYAVLNRRYKPLGFNTLDNVDYADYPICMHLPGLTPAKAARISWCASESLERIFLYNDSCIPTTSRAAMDAYLERLRRLAKLKVRA